MGMSLDRTTADLLALVKDGRPHPVERVARCREAWDREGAYAADRAAVLAFACAGRAVDLEGEIPTPPEPTPDLAAALGVGMARAIEGAHLTWDVLANAQTGHGVGVIDPFIADDHRALVDHLGAEAVFWYAWWAHLALLALVDRHKRMFPTYLAEITQELATT